MIPYIVLIIIIIVLRSQVYAKEDSLQKQRFENGCAFFVWLAIVLMAALRHPTVGADTLGYISDYSEVKNLSFSGINERFKGYLGYYYTSKVFTILGLPVQVWLGFVELLYAISLSLFVDKYSEDKLFSILVFVTTGLFSFSMAGLKQVLSMSLMMFAYLLFAEKKYIFTCVLVAFAYTCHPAGLIFLIAFPFYILRNKVYDLFLILFFVGFIVAFGGLFLARVVNFIGDEHYEAYLAYDNSYTSTTLVFYVVIIVISLLGYKGFFAEKPEIARLCLGFSIIAVGLQTMSSFSPNMFRLAYLFSPFLMALLPNSCNYITRHNKTMVRTVLMGVLIFYFLYTGRTTPFLFYWQ